MAEAGIDSAAQQITLVWAEADWPGGAPVVGQSHRIAGLPDTVPQQVIRAVSCQIPAEGTLDALLAQTVTDQAARLIETRAAHVAVFGRRMRPGMSLYPGDRVELLGPVTADPKSARRKRVASERAGSGGRKWRAAGTTN